MRYHLHMWNISCLIVSFIVKLSANDPRSYIIVYFTIFPRS